MERDGGSSRRKRRLMQTVFGQSTVEYFLIASLTAMILISGSPSTISEVVSAIKSYYKAYQNAMCQPVIEPPTALAFN